MHINPVTHGYAERAVGWMDAVKKVFGVVLLGVAIWLVSPVMPIMATMLLIGGLLVMCAIFYQRSIRCHAAAGRTSDAIATYLRLKQLLSITLALKPSVATERRLQSLRAQ